MRAQIYIKNFLAKRQRYFPNKDLDETVQIIKQGVKDGSTATESALDVHKYLGHCEVNTPYGYFIVMVAATRTHININEGLIRIKKEVKNSSNVISVRK